MYTRQTEIGLPASGVLSVNASSSCLAQIFLVNHSIEKFFFSLPVATFLHELMKWVWVGWCGGISVNPSRPLCVECIFSKTTGQIFVYFWLCLTMSAELMKTKFVRRPSVVRLWHRLSIILSYCMDFFQITVVASPEPYAQAVFFFFFFLIFYEYFSFSLTWDPMGAKTLLLPQKHF